MVLNKVANFKKHLDILRQQMHISVELRNVKLEDEHTGEKERHLDEIAHAHGLEPDLVGQAVWPNFSLHIALIEKAQSFVSAG